MPEEMETLNPTRIQYSDMNNKTLCFRYQDKLHGAPGNIHSASTEQRPVPIFGFQSAVPKRLPRNEGSWMFGNRGQFVPAGFAGAVMDEPRRFPAVLSILNNDRHGL